MSINKIEKPLNVMQLKQDVEHDVWYFSSRSIQEKYLDTLYKFVNYMHNSGKSI